jgi:hypothetical protein
MGESRRRFLIGVVGAGSAALAGCSGPTSDGPGGGGDDTTAAPTWLTTELTEVTSGETFSVAGLAAERPVLLETFAVWCSTCTAQQRAIAEYHEAHGDAAHSVSLDIDPNEGHETVRDHVESNGFDWRYAVAPATLSTALADAFGQSVLTPPRAPMIVVCRADADAARRLQDGVKGADVLHQVVEGC